MQRSVLWAAFGALVATGLASEGAAAPPPDAERLFRETVAPLLVSECYRCHSSEARDVRGGLRLDSLAAMRAGGDSGPAVVPGNAEESLLLRAIRHEDGLEMPPKRPKVPEAVAAAVESWIAAGAPVTAEFGGTNPTDPIAAARASHWAFRPVADPAPPPLAPGTPARDPIDAFLLDALAAKGWTFAPPADRADWIRRVTFDLTGLPPTPEEVDAFLGDTATDAEARVVDRLLDSPRYGERWAQHWLDVVRFAETEGYEYDRTVPGAWRFRDYVIESLNRDKPFDQFAREQLAGDERDDAGPEELAASIFHRLGPVRRNAGNPEIALSRNEVLTERTDIIGSAFLGLTVGCARCHNHKLEPITQKDYYRLQAYFAATAEHDVRLIGKEEEAAWEAEVQAIKDRIEAIRKRMRSVSREERRKLAAEIKALDESMPPPPPTIPATRNDPANRTAMHVLRRGVWEQKGEPVGPRPPSVLVDPDEPELPPTSATPRTRLADWLTAPSHPLTPRVIVNRVWAHHFGRGLVKSVNDFGTKGEPPSHPELLDWLTSRFLEGGWRLKPLHRRIVLSAAYRQADRSPAESDARRLDPENRLLWHFPRRRLSAEEVRDAMLAASGRLNPKAGGPSVMVPVDPALVNLLYKPSQWQVTEPATEHDRRTIYLIAKRNLRLPFMETFDAPASQTSCAVRESSTHAPQALELLNGTLSNDLARALAARLRRDCGDDHGKAVDRAFRLALGRPPTASERATSLRFLREQPLEEFALAVFNLNGFLYVR